MKPRPLLVGIGFVAGYILLDWVSYIHPMQRYSITPWNPQPALAIALLMVGGQRWLPLVLLATVAAECLVRGASPAAPSTWLVGAVLALGYAAIASALGVRFPISPTLGSRRDVLRLTAVVAVGAFGTGVLYIAALLASGTGPLTEPFAALLRFWIGDAVGIIVTLPVLLMATVRERRAEFRALVAKPETIAHAAITAAALAVVFATPAQDQVKYFYVLFLPLVAVATRFGLAGATLAAVVIQGAVIISGQLAGHPTLTIFEFQTWLLALTVTGLFLGVTVDERTNAETELRASLRMAAAGEMAAALAHELNQPLTAVTNYARASRLIAGQPAPDLLRLVETLEKLVAEASRAGEVVTRLRDFFRTGATRLAPVAIDEVASRVLASYGAKADALGVTLERRVPLALPALLGDELQLEVVIRNLVANALEAAAARDGRRVVCVEVLQDRSGEVKTTVEDSGGGVAAGDAQRIFEPFETSRATGMGMGLAISRAIVEAHGGRLWAEPGTRGVFSFTLPAAETP